MVRQLFGILALAGFCGAQSIEKFPVSFSGFGVVTGPDGALWLTPGLTSPSANVGRITTAGVFTSVPLPAGFIPGGPIVTGPDGALWLQIVSNNDSAALRLTTSGTTSEFVFDQTDGIFGMTVGPDGAIWMAEFDRISRLITSGGYSSFLLTNLHPTAIVAGPDGNLWFPAINDEGNASVIGRITPSGTITTFPYSGVVPILTLNTIAAGPDGGLWFTIYATPGGGFPAIGRISTTGTITTYTIPDTSTYDFSESSIAASPDGGLWFTGNGAIGRITTEGSASVYPLDPTAWALYVGGVGMGIVAGPDGGMWFSAFGNDGVGRASLTAPTAPAVSPTSLAFSTPMGQTPASKTFQVSSGSGTFTYSLTVSYTSTTSVNWIDLPSLGGNVSPGNPAAVTVAIASAASTLGPGSYTANVNINTGAGNTPLTVAVTLNISAPAAPQPTTTTLTAAPTSQTAGQPVTLTATVTPATATGSVTFFDGTSSLGVVAVKTGSASMSTSTLAVGSHTLTASYGGDAGDSPSNSGPVGVTITNSNQPTILTGGILNAASYAVLNGAGAPVAPGSLVAIFTSSLNTQAASFNTASLPPSLSNVSVTFNGVTAPVVAVSPTGAAPYVSVQVPFEALAAGQSSATVPVVLTVNDIPSNPVQESVVASAPGIFTIPATGQGNAVLVNLADYTIAAPAGSIGSSHPIPRGQPAFFYVTGLGLMTPSVVDGSGDCPAPNGLCNANAMPQVFVGGVQATQIAYAGQAPGYPGVEQINFTIPENAPTGNSVALVVISADGTVTSNTATIAVQ
jgi:uncharacterized protein (TIGR03437 family)